MRKRFGVIGGVGALLFGSVGAFAAGTPDRELLAALIEVESGGDDQAVGDKNLRHRAYGCLQIRQPYVDDVNEVRGTDYRAEDCLGNRELSIWIYREYMKRWATKKRLGREPTREDIARIHNGGPNGWRRDSTKPYWRKVKKVLDKNAKKK